MTGALSSLNLDRALEAHIELPEFAWRHPVEHHPHVRAEHPSPRDDAIHLVLPCLVARLALNHRLERVTAARISNFISCDQVRRDAVVDAAEDLSRHRAWAIDREARQRGIRGEPFRERE